MESIRCLEIPILHVQIISSRADQLSRRLIKPKVVRSEIFSLLLLSLMPIDGLVVPTRCVKPRIPFPVPVIGYIRVDVFIFQHLHVLAAMSALGAYYQRMKSRLGAPKAITATAHKLARIFYRMLKYGQAFVQVGVEFYEQKFKERIVDNLKKRAEALGYVLLENQPVS